MTIYWIIQPDKNTQLAVNAWITENYPDIHHFGKNVSIIPDWNKYRFPPHISLCIWFNSCNHPDIDVIFKLANSDHILDQRLEEPM